MAEQPNITRRSFFKGLPLAGMAASLPMLAANAPVSARERLDNAIAELKGAATECYPQIQDWVIGDGNTAACPLVISALGPINPNPEPLLADDVTGTDAFAKWEAWERENR